MTHYNSYKTFNPASGFPSLEVNKRKETTCHVTEKTRGTNVCPEKTCTSEKDTNPYKAPSSETKSQNLANILLASKRTSWDLLKMQTETLEMESHGHS